MKNTLRVKQINEFIESLNEREQNYLKKQILKRCYERDVKKLDFTKKSYSIKLLILTSKGFYKF